MTGQTSSYTQPEQRDARQGTGDPLTDPAAAGERSVAEPDANGGATPHDEPRPEPGTGTGTSEP